METLEVISPLLSCCASTLQHPAAPTGSCCSKLQEQIFGSNLQNFTDTIEHFDFYCKKIMSFTGAESAALCFVFVTLKIEHKNYKKLHIKRLSTTACCRVLPVSCIPQNILGKGIDWIVCLPFVSFNHDQITKLVFVTPLICHVTP